MSLSCRETSSNTLSVETIIVRIGYAELKKDFIHQELHHKSLFMICNRSSIEPAQKF